MVPALTHPLTAVPVSFQPLPAKQATLGSRAGSVGIKLDILSRPRSAQMKTPLSRLILCFSFLLSSVASNENLFMTIYAYLHFITAPWLSILCMLHREALPLFIDQGTFT